jgi:ATP-binding cassette, subfamily B, multidrug efflux pump
MDTLVGERGVTLSGGQKQRATLARGLIRQAPVLVLDDCFSSVDTGTEDHILDRSVAARRAHHPAGVAPGVHRPACDRIVVLDEGRIAEVGSHDELIALGGIYAELERIQREGADEGDFDFIEVPG